MITPIYIPISKTPSGPDHKCPKCGHEWDNKVKPMSSKAKRILFLCLFLFTLVIIDWAAFQGRHTYHVILKKECQYSNDGYEIVSKGNLYAVKQKDTQYGSEKYLRTQFGSILPRYVEISKPNTFYSECKARSYLKRYYDVSQRKKLRQEKKTSW